VGGKSEDLLNKGWERALGKKEVDPLSAGKRKEKLVNLM